MLADEGPGGFTTRKVAQGAETSIPAVYELFGDKAGLVREIFFEGFRQLRRHFGQLEDTDDPRADLILLFELFRAFVRENPVLTQVMYSRPFGDFDPGPDDAAATSSVRRFIIGHVKRALTPESWPATKPMSRTYFSGSRRVSPPRRPRAGSRHRERPRIGAGPSRSRRHSTDWHLGDTALATRKAASGR
jgi:AcrR family transcriptional regulator